MERRRYSKPLLAEERFAPQEYCVICAGGVPNVGTNSTYAYLDTDSDGRFDNNEQGEIQASDHAFSFTRTPTFYDGIIANGVKVGNATYNGAIYEGLKIYQYKGNGRPSSSSMTDNVTRYDNANLYTYVGTFDVFRRAGSSTVYVVGGVSASGDGYQNNHS